MPRANQVPPRSAKETTNCFNCLNKDRSEWCMLNNGEVQQLNDKKTARVFQPRQFIFHQGDPCDGIYFVESGTVAVRKMDENGNAVMVRLRHRGDSIGYRDFFVGGVFTVSAEALATSNVCFVDKASVRQLLDLNPALGLGFIRGMVDDLQSAEDTILQTAVLPIRKRLAHLLLTLKDRYATVDDEGVMLLDLPLARNDIAAILGSRRETIARAIQALEQDSVAFFSGRHVRIADLDTLLDEIETHDEP